MIYEVWGFLFVVVGWKVDYVIIIIMESDVFYFRLVLVLGKSLDKEVVEVFRNDWFCSVDMCFFDVIVFVLWCWVFLFINKKVVEEVVGVLIKGVDLVKRFFDFFN